MHQPCIVSLRIVCRKSRVFQGASPLNKLVQCLALWPSWLTKLASLTCGSVLGTDELYLMSVTVEAALKIIEPEVCQLTVLGLEWELPYEASVFSHMPLIAVIALLLTTLVLLQAVLADPLLAHVALPSAALVCSEACFVEVATVAVRTLLPTYH